MTSRSKAWTNVQDLENIKAILGDVQEHLGVIRTQAWHGKGPQSRRQIFVEATQALRKIKPLEDALIERHAVLFETAQAEEK